MTNVKELVIISGKGGTGKTSLTASFGYLNSQTAIMADCDVDAADMHLLTEPKVLSTEKFYSGFFPSVNHAECRLCGKCAKVCRFDAITIDKEVAINPIDCEGCGYCAAVCPAHAIAMEDNYTGNLYVSDSRFGNKLVHARLGIAAENSGKLVAKVKATAKNLATESNTELIIVDGSPGIGCPVISSLSGASYVVIVTEATVSGLNDLKRVSELAKKFGIKTGCIINKADLNTDRCFEIEKFVTENGMDLLGAIPYDDTFTKALTNGKTIVEFSENGLAEKVKNIWNNIEHKLKEA